MALHQGQLHVHVTSVVPSSPALSSGGSPLLGASCSASTALKSSSWNPCGLSEAFGGMMEPELMGSSAPQ